MTKTDGEEDDIIIPVAAKVVYGHMLLLIADLTNYTYGSIFFVYG
jgi:hypothetical protein